LGKEDRGKKTDPERERLGERERHIIDKNIGQHGLYYLMLANCRDVTVTANARRLCTKCIHLHRHYVLQVPLCLGITIATPVDIMSCLPQYIATHSWRKLNERKYMLNVGRS
jgi:hypothetical protein